MSGARRGEGWTAPGRSGPVVLVTRVGAATGSRAAAAALSCAASGADRAALLIDLDEGRPPRPSPIATAAARALEERLAAHMPDAAVASRGSICCLSLSGDGEGVGRIAAALPLVRGSAAIVHLPPPLWRPALEAPRVDATAALIRADLDRDRPLTALAARDLIDRGLRAAVLKRALSRPAGSAALIGLPIARRALPPRLPGRLLHSPRSTVSQGCYSRQDDAETEPEGAAQPERRDHAGAGPGRGLHRHPQRGAGR